MTYRVSKEARHDLDGIFIYWAHRASLETAERLVDAIVERFWVIGQHPTAGRAVDDIASGVKCFPAGEYLIYYRKTTRAVNIARIVHVTNVTNPSTSAAYPLPQPALQNSLTP